MNLDVSLIQSRIDVALAARRARQQARLDMPEVWLPVVLEAISGIARLGVVVDRATVKYGGLRIVMRTQDTEARAIEAEAAAECARLSGFTELRFLVLVRCRQFGPERVGRALANDPAALEALRASHSSRPSEALAEVLRTVDEHLQADLVVGLRAFLTGQG